MPKYKTCNNLIDNVSKLTFLNYKKWAPIPIFMWPIRGNYVPLLFVQDKLNLLLTGSKWPEHQTGRKKHYANSLKKTLCKWHIICFMCTEIKPVEHKAHEICKKVWKELLAKASHLRCLELLDHLHPSSLPIIKIEDDSVLTPLVRRLRIPSEKTNSDPSNVKPGVLMHTAVCSYRCAPCDPSKKTVSPIQLWARRTITSDSWAQCFGV